MPGATSNIKGSCIKSVEDFVRNRGGKPLWDKIVSRLTPEEGALFTGLILAGDWYPLSAYNHLLNAIAEELSAGNPVIGLEIGRKVIADGLSGIYKIFLDILNTGYILSKAPLLWKRYFDRETMQILDVSARHLLISVSDDFLPGKTFCNSVLGGILLTIERSGGKNATGREIHCRSEHAAHCQFDISWE